MKKLLLFVILLSLLIPAAVQAQEETEVRFYIMPIEVVNETKRGPAYLKWRFNPDGVDAPWSMKDFGFQDTCIVAADVTAAQHQTLVANSDVVAAPANIDNIIDTVAKRDNVRDKLEDLNVPAGWVQTGMSYREVLRPVTHLFMFAQRYHALTGRKMVEPGYNLNTRISDLPLEVRQGLQQAADDLGYDTSGIAGSWLYRRGLKHLGDQWGESPVIFGDLVTL